MYFKSTLLRRFFFFVFPLFLLTSFNNCIAQIVTYGSDSSGSLASVATNATGNTLIRVNGATRPATPCSSGFSGASFTTATTYSSSLPALEEDAAPNTGYTLNITGFSVDIRRSTTGPANVRYAYSTDGGTTWTDQGFDQTPYNGSCGTTTTAAWTTSFTVAYPSTIKFRVYAFNASGTTGTLQILNLYINGTVSGSSSGCGMSSGLSATSVTSTSAVLNWTAVSGASSYNIRYRIVGSGTWSTTTSSTTSVTVTGLTPSSTYEFQVQAVCSSSSTGSFTGSTDFTTSAAAAGCDTSASLSATSVTATSAVLNWSAVSGAASYSIRYRIVGSGTWSTTTSSTTSVTITGLTPSSNYEFQVETICSSSSTSAFTSSGYFTTPPITSGCGTPTGLSATSVTSTSAILNWGAVSGASSYNIHYRIVGTGTWSATTSSTTSVTVTGLTPSSNYEFQVQAVCSSSSTGSYSGSTDFTTLGSASTGSTGKIAIYFNTPVNTSVSTGVNAVYLSSSMADTIVAYINRARYSVDIAQYDYNQSTGFANIATAVNAAYAAGKKVRWIYDGSQPNTGLALLSSGIHTLASPTSSAYGIMHNKFVIIDANSSNPDDAIVCTGSEDWGVTQFNQDNNNLLFIQDSALAHAYQAEFNMMWGDTGVAPNTSLSKFGPYKSDLGLHTFTIGGKTVELYFSPAEHTDTHIQSSINSANTDLYFGVYDFTESTDATDIVARHTAGVYTLGIVDQYSEGSSGYSTLSSGLGSSLKTYASSSLIYHNKMLIVDPSNTCSDPLVLTGSHNWTTSADTKNDENTLIIHDDTVANIYYQSFYANYTALGGSLTSITPCSSTTCGTATGLSASSVTSTSALLNWTAVSGATSYSIQYRQTGTTTWSTTTSGTNSVTVTGLTPATTYEFQVQATCSAGTSSYSSSVDFTTLGAPCSVPTGLSTTGVTSTSATLNWIAVSGAVSYNIQYRQTGTTTWSTTTSATNSVTISGLTAGVTYEFQVSVVCTTGTTAYSGSTTFSTPTITCPLPTGLTHTAVSSTSELLNWGAVSGATGYTIRYRVTGTSGWSFTASAVNSVTITGLTAATSYEFQVQAMCSTTDSSGYTISTVSTLGIISAQAAGFSADEFKVYPNPTTASVTVSYILSEQGKVSLSVCNLLGQEINTVTNGEIQLPGKQVYSLNLDTPGMYFVKLTIDNVTYYRKVVKL